MNRFRDQLFTCTALTLDQNGGPAWRNLSNKVKESQHRLALADDIFKVIALLQGPFELDDLFFRAMPGDRGADVGKQLFVVPRLLDEVLRACTDSVDNVADGAVGGDHDNRKIGLHLDDAR